MWYVTITDIFISGTFFVKHIFVTKTLSKDKVPSSFQDFSSYKNSSFCKV